MKDFKNLIELNKYFSTEDKARKYIEKLIWNSKPVCPHCGNEKVYKFSDGKRYKCANSKCYKKFTVTVGTIFENTNIPFIKWINALYLSTSHKKGISSHQLAKDIGITQKSAWFMLSRIREMLKSDAPHLLSGHVEADETYIGGKATNKHILKRIELRKAGTGYIHHTAVFGMLQRDGKVFTQVVNEASGLTLKPIIREKLAKGSILITDGFGAYHKLNEEYQHEIINHEKQVFVKGSFHTNTLEGFWSHLKRGLHGVYHHASKKHLHRYCNEYAFRWNTKKMNEVSRLEYALTLTKGRLKYKDLIKN